MEQILAEVKKATPWHSLPAEEVLKLLATTIQGLTSKAARLRKKFYGKNQLKEQKQRTIWQRLFSQYNNILIYILLASGTTALILAHWIDAIVIFMVVILNTSIGFIQEGKAEKALQAIQHMLSHQTTVIRNAKRIVIDAKFLVPGDIVLLQSGDKVPADIRLFNVKSLQIQEALLTGESIPVTKTATAVIEAAALADRTSMAYSGTLVTNGRSEGIVVATGEQTEIGQISRLTAYSSKFKTPLLRQINSLGRWLTIAILLVSAITFVIGLFVWQDTSVSMFLAVVSLAVAAIPEGLPAIMTIIFAIGVTRMAKRNAIIRHLPAIETTGSVTVICTDKTGTLTHNELAVRQVIMAEHNYYVTGSGYNDTGEFRLNNALFSLDEHQDLYQLIRAGILCNDAELLKENNKWQLQGNPLDGAFLALGLKLKMDLSFERKSYPRIDLIPFESQHKIMASLHHDHKGNNYIFIKGAPERILTLCTYERFQHTDQPLNLPYWEKMIHVLASQGQRLLAVAATTLHSQRNELTLSDLGTNLTLLGIVGLIDPPRKEAITAVAKCQAAGIKVKMITGDHTITARAIAEQIGIKNCHQVITGEELDRMDEKTLMTVVKDIDIYARTSPIHKLRLVQALQKNGEIVAMTGDGVNDVPALKQANIGIAMGQKSTEASKEVSDMILADDNFASIVHAIEEGRTIYDNLRKTLLFVLPTNGGEAFIIVAAITLGYLLPITAPQILWLNMVTAVTFALSLAFEPAEGNVMQRAPHVPHEPILSGWMIWRIIFVLSLMTISGFTIFLYERSINTDLMAARCAVVNMLVVAECVYLFNCRKLYNLSPWQLRTFFGNKALLIAIMVVAVLQLCFTYLPIMDHFFEVSPIGIDAWIRIFMLAVGIFIAVKLEKAFLSGKKLH